MLRAAAAEERNGNSEQLNGPGDAAACDLSSQSGFNEEHK